MTALTATTGTFSGAVSGITTLAIGGALTGATTGSFSAGVLAACLANSTTTAAYVPPVYTSAGAALASTTHIVQGPTFLVSGTATVVTLTGAAVFSNSSSYTVVASMGTSFSAIEVNYTSGSSFSLYQTSGNNYLCSWIAIGA
jgi:hypothetical protein